MEKYGRIFNAGIPNWGLDATVAELLCNTISSYGRYPDGAEWFNVGSSSTYSYYFFSGSMLDSESQAVAVLYLWPEEAYGKLTLADIRADFGSALVFHETMGVFGLPYYEASLGDSVIQFFVEDETPRYAFIQESGAEPVDAEGTMRELAQPMASGAGGMLSPDLRTGSRWEPVNAYINCLGRPMAEIQSELTHTESLTRTVYLGFYEDGFMDSNTGVHYLTLGNTSTGVCDAINVPLYLIFPETDGAMTPDSLSEYWELPYRYSEYEIFSYIFPFSDLKFFIYGTLFAPTSPGDFLFLCEIQN